MGKVELEPLKGLKGLNSLSPEEQNDWINKQVSAGALPKNWKASQADRLYRNKLFIEEFGPDEFRQYKDPSQRDSLYEEAIVNRATDEYYKEDKDYNIISNLGTESKKELLESKYLNDKEYRDYIDSNYEQYVKTQNKINKWSPDNFDAGTNNIQDKNSWLKSKGKFFEGRSKYLQDLVARDKAAKENDPDTQNQINSLSQFLETGQNAWVSANQMFQNNDVDGAIDYMASNYLITKEQAANLKSRPQQQKTKLTGEVLSNSDFAPGAIGALFDSVAIPRTVTEKSPFGEKELTYQMPGSRTYNALKDTKKFDNFTDADKLRAYATWQVMSQKYGVQDAIIGLENNMMKYVKDNETAGDWWSDVGTNIVLGGVANIMNKVNAVGNIVTETKDGKEALAYKLQGKNPDGSERRQPENGDLYDWFVANWDNPYYWSKVDEYNTLDPIQIADIDAKGGISPYTTLQLPTAPKFFSKDSAKEALKMMKFAWSDYLTGQVLGGVVGLGTNFANTIGGTTLQKAVGVAGSWGVAAAMGLGIAESYGVTTFEQTYQQMMEELDKRRDTTAENYAKGLLSLPENKEQIDGVVKDIMQRQQQANIGKENPLFISEDVVRQQVENDFVNYHIQQYNNSDEATLSRNDDEALARKAAVNSYIVDSTVEELRMAFVNVNFRKYLFNNTARKYLPGNNKYAKPSTTPTGELAEGNRFWNRTKAVLKPVWGGFESNYFDDVTVGLGRGFGLQQYNSYLQDKYDARKDIKAGEYTFAFFDGLQGGLEGAKEAIYDRQSFYDGFIGALGTPVSTTLRLTSSDRAKAMEQMDAKEGEKLSVMQTINKYVANPLLEAYYEAKGNETRSQQALPTVNKVLRDKKEALEHINDSVIGLNKVSEAEASGDDLTRRDARARQAFDLLYDMAGASTSPIITESPLVQNATETIDRMASGNIYDGEIQAFLAQPENRGVRSYADAQKIAKERIQSNAKSLQEMNKRIVEANNSLEESALGQNISPELKKQLVFQLAMQDVWNQREGEVEHSINGSTKWSNGHNAVARYGNKTEFDRQLSSKVDEKARLITALNLAKLTTKTAKEIYDLAKEDGDPDKIESTKNEWLKEQLLMQRYVEAIRDLNVELKQMKKEESIFEEDSEVPVVTASQILALNPEERAIILNKDNRRNYSEEQQVEIDKALADVRMRTTDADRLISDSGRLYSKIRDNKAAYDRIVRNPDAAAAYVSTILESRTRRLIDVLNERRIDDVYDIFDNAESDEALLLSAKQALNSKDYNLRARHIDAYIKKNPEKSGVLKGLSDVAKIREDAKVAIDDIISDKNAKNQVINNFVEATNDANNGQEAMSALESLIDNQKDATAKLQLDRILEEMKSLGHQRDATKLRNRELERQKKQEAETKRLEEEAKKDGKNFNWDGYKVGDVVYDKNGNKGIVEGFEKTSNGDNKMIVKFPLENNKSGRFRYDSATEKNNISKEKPQSAPENSIPIIEDTAIGNHQETNAELTEVKEVPLEITVDSDGAVESPSAEQQAAAQATRTIPISEEDVADQGNNIQETTGIISGNRWVTYSIDALRNGIVKEEVPESSTSIYGVLYNWLKDNKIALQEIIDEEFGRVLIDNPDTRVQFMKVKSDNSNLSRMLFNVIEFTPEVKKYHQDSRGGVVEANGKSWLIVGVTGFDNNASETQMEAFDTMRAPINNRSKVYFSQNGNEQYYVDSTAHTTVQNTTSGRIINQRMGQESPRLKKVSELLKSSGKTLKQAEFGIQTKQIENRGFVVTKNVKDPDKVFGPKNIEDNRGRTFILIDTPNGYKIPGMIEPSMYNNLEDGSPLKDFINQTITRLFDTDYAKREEAIKELCEYLVLSKNDKNILIGREGTNTITITKKDSTPITQSLGKDFDMAKFFKDFENANFQINTIIRNLNDPVKVQMYDDSGALTTTVDSMRTVGMSYTLYMTDTSGNPIINVPVGNAVPGTGKSSFKKYRSARVNNVTYELEGSKFVNRNTGETVEPGTPLSISCSYNLFIRESNRTPFDSRNGIDYYIVPNKNGGDFVIARDGLGNVILLSLQESNKMIEDVQRKHENQERLQNLEDVDLGDEQPVKLAEKSDTLTQEQINQQMVGNFEAPAKEVKKQSQEEVVQEAKENKSQDTKYSADDVGTKSLTDLHNSNNLTTFDAIVRDFNYSKELYSILRQKGWNITGKFSKDIEILKSKGVPVIGITNVKDWLDLIRNCK